MAIIIRSLILCLSLFLCVEAKATVPVVRYPSGTPVQVCQPSDTNTNCGGGTGGSGTVSPGTVTHLAVYTGTTTVGSILEAIFAYLPTPTLELPGAEMVVGGTAPRGTFDVISAAAISNVGTVTVTPHVGSGNFNTGNGYTDQWTVYAINANGNYSLVGSSASFDECAFDGCSGQQYYVTLSWAAVASAVMYKIVIGEDDYDGYFGDYYLTTTAPTVSINYGDGTELTATNQNPMITTPSSTGPDFYIDRTTGDIVPSQVFDNNVTIKGNGYVNGDFRITGKLRIGSTDAPSYPLDIFGSGFRFIEPSGNKPFLFSFDGGLWKIDNGDWVYLWFTPQSAATRHLYLNAAVSGGFPMDMHDNIIDFAHTQINMAGNLKVSGLTASRPVFTDSSKNLTSTGTIPVNQGGTNQTSYTNGQLLIGNTTGNTLTVSTLTGTSNQVIVINGTGSITLSTPQSIGTGSSPSFAGLTLTGDLTLSTHNIITDTTTGTKIGTSTTQKLGFFNSTPIVKPTGDACTAFQNLGLISSCTVTATTNANLTGAVTSVGNATSLGSFSSSNLLGALTDETGSGAAVFGTAPTFTTSITTSSANIITDTTTGTKIGTATNQKLGFFNATPIVQPSGDVCTALQNLGIVTSCTEAAITAPATLTGSTDAVQLDVIGNATQTNNIFRVKSSGGTSLYTVDNNGNAILNGTMTTGGTGQSTIGYGVVVNSGGNTTANGGDFVFKNSAGTTVYTIGATSSHTVIAGTAPTLSSCGTSPSVVGNDNAFEITVGSVSATGCTASFATAFANAPVCTVTNQSMSVVNALTYTVSTSAVTISQTGLTSAKVDVICQGR